MSDPFLKPLLQMASLGVYGFRPSTSGFGDVSFARGDREWLRIVGKSWQLNWSGYGYQGPAAQVFEWAVKDGFELAQVQTLTLKTQVLLNLVKSRAEIQTGSYKMGSGAQWEEPVKEMVAKGYIYVVREKFLRLTPLSARVVRA